jgi:hypothetical protein
MRSDLCAVARDPPAEAEGRGSSGRVDRINDKRGHDVGAFLLLEGE